MHKGEDAVAALVELGPVAIGPLGRFLLDGKPCKVFQPRLWAVKALARLGARDLLMVYLLQQKEIADPEERFGEEAVQSAAARFLANWPDEETRRFLLRFSENHVLNGLIDALAELKTVEAIPFFERALEDDFYRPAAENAFLMLGPVAVEALVQSALTPHPDALTETPGSLKRRRCAVRLLNIMGISSEPWKSLRRLLHESDPELVVESAKLAIRWGLAADNAFIVQRLIECSAGASWQVRGEVKEILKKFRKGSGQQIDEAAV